MHARAWLAACFGLCLSACARDESRPHVILVTMDTLRADALGCYGASGNPSPKIDSFAAGATLYERCVSTAPWTVPSHASLFTGLFPFEHGAISFDIERRAINVNPLAEEHTTLAEALREEGYHTGGFVANRVYLDPRHGLAQGFDEWDVAREQGTMLNHRALRWLDAAIAEDPTRPCLLFVNYMDTHRPYNVLPAEGEREYSATEQPSVLLDRLIETVMVNGKEDAALEALVREQYARSVRNLDRAVGELFTALRERDLFENSVIVLTSDHGEYFGEHGLVEHSKDVYEEALAVPLILRAPGQEHAERESALASLVDVPALILDRLPESVRQRPLEIFERRPGTHAVFAENHFSRPKDLLRPEFQGRFRRERTVLYVDSYKYILSTDGRHELFHLESGEGTNLVERESEVAGKLADEIERAIEVGRWQGTPVAPGAIDAEYEAAMQALGYLGGDEDDGRE